MFLNNYCGGMNLSLRRYCLLWVKTLMNLLNPTSVIDASHSCVLHMIGTPFLRFNVYKARVGGVSSWCRIEQIREGDISPTPISKADNTWLGKIHSSHKRHLFVEGQTFLLEGIVRFGWKPLQICSIPHRGETPPTFDL